MVWLSCHLGVHFYVKISAKELKEWETYFGTTGEHIPYGLQVDFNSSDLKGRDSCISTRYCLKINLVDDWKNWPMTDLVVYLKLNQICVEGDDSMPWAEDIHLIQ